eukprot:3476183-Amphidinium_carterae.1
MHWRSWRLRAQLACTRAIEMVVSRSQWGQPTQAPSQCQPMLATSEAWRSPVGQNLLRLSTFQIALVTLTGAGRRVQLSDLVATALPPLAPDVVGAIVLTLTALAANKEARFRSGQ